MPSQTPPAVEVRDIVKTFPDPAGDGALVTAVDHVSLAIADGEFFALLGPSGCGKSTLLRMLAGLDRPTSGDVWIHGRRMGDTPPYQRPVNMVFQSYALFPHLTVFQNVAFGLEMAGRPRDEIRARVADALAMVRLPGVADRKPGQLSGGQQQRIALARALVNRPEVLLLDEPLGALDLKLRKEMQLELKALQREVGITFVYVTHDQEEALTMSDRIAVMDAGRLLQVGSPTVVYERPSCRFVADFIGEANFLEGVVAAIEDGIGTVRIDGNGLALTGLPQGHIAVGQRVTYAVRPEKVLARTEPPGGAGSATAVDVGGAGIATAGASPAALNCVPAVVENVAYIGSDTRVLVRFGAGSTLSVWEQNDLSTLDPDAYFRRGEAVWLTWRPENALLLGE